jgi:aminoglycoside phosphotransferase (APT) family kinase protein
MTAANRGADGTPKPPAGRLDGNDAPDRVGIARALHPFLGRVSVERLTRLSGGAHKEIWSFDAVAADGTLTELVLRRDPPGLASEPDAVHREAAAITAAHAAGLPVPELLFISEVPGIGAAGMVMQRVAGETIARRILRDEAFSEARRVLVGQLARFAAGLHALDAPSFFPAPDPVADLRAQLDGFGRPSEVFEQALDWLAAHQPRPREPVLVHGDFRLGNLVVEPDGLAAVLDWELTHAGSPAEDLGWLCVKAWRFGAPLPAAGLGSRENLLAAYRAADGADIGPAELRWWEVLGTLRWGVICLAQADAHLSGAHRSVELAAIGRRMCEQEWDLLLMLDPAAAQRAAAARPRPAGAGRSSPAPYGRPTASELLEAVREYLVGGVMPGTDGQLSFHARVAANVLAIVARELELGSAGPHADIADAVAARLAVANPKHFESPPP